jgi:hypothetical protein
MKTKILTYFNLYELNLKIRVLCFNSFERERERERERQIVSLIERETLNRPVQFYLKDRFST